MIFVSIHWFLPWIRVKEAFSRDGDVRNRFFTLFLPLEGHFSAKKFFVERALIFTLSHLTFIPPPTPAGVTHEFKTWKFVRIRVPHSQKPPSTKNQPILRHFWVGVRFFYIKIVFPLNIWASKKVIKFDGKMHFQCGFFKNIVFNNKNFILKQFLTFNKFRKLIFQKPVTVPKHVEKVVEKLLKSCRKVIEKLSKSCWKVVEKLLKNVQKT